MVIREHPYCDNIEEAIFFTALGRSALRSEERNASSGRGDIEFLEYLAESYSSGMAEKPTTRSNPSQDFDMLSIKERSERTGDGAANGSPLVGTAGNAYSGGDGLRVLQATVNCYGGRLYVEGIPKWTLHFLIGMFALRDGDSPRAMGAMENAFLCYEIWLPRCLQAIPESAGCGQPTFLSKSFANFL